MVSDHDQASPSDDETCRECPELACSDADPDPECATCKGRGMVTYEEWRAWHERRMRGGGETF